MKLPFKIYSSQSRLPHYKPPPSRRMHIYLYTHITILYSWILFYFVYIRNIDNYCLLCEFRAMVFKNVAAFRIAPLYSCAAATFFLLLFVIFCATNNIHVRGWLKERSIQGNYAHTKVTVRMWNFRLNYAWSTNSNLLIVSYFAPWQWSIVTQMQTARRAMKTKQKHVSKPHARAYISPTTDDIYFFLNL